MRPWLLAALLCCFSAKIANCEDWKKIYTLEYQQLYSRKVLNFHLDTFYDKDNVKKADDSPIFTVWTKSIRKFNQVETSGKQLYQLNCKTRKFKILDGGITDISILDRMPDDITPDSVPGNLAEILCGK